MPIPEFQTFMLPVLELSADGQEHSLVRARDALAQTFRLTEAERAELLPSGRQRRFDNRVAWAKVYLQRAGLLSSDRRAHFRITERGREVLASRPLRIDIPVVRRFPEFLEFQGREAASDDDHSEANGLQGTVEARTPEEVLEQAYQRIRSELAAEILARVKAGSARFFENLVVELLLKTGYGRSHAEAGRAIGSSGDEGIDGVISEDRLGLDMIFIQAKRWEGTVGRPEIQKFVGALHGRRARKGVFITTSSFSEEAHQYVSHIDPRVVLIDGRQLAEYMVDYGIGVAQKATYEIRKVDSDYFAEE